MMTCKQMSLLSLRPLLHDKCSKVSIAIALLHHPTFPMVELGRYVLWLCGVVRKLPIAGRESERKSTACCEDCDVMTDIMYQSVCVCRLLAVA